MEALHEQPVMSVGGSFQELLIRTWCSDFRGEYTV